MGGHIGKKHAAAGVLAVAAVLLAAWLFTRPSPLAEIHRSFSSPETGSADVSFPVEAGERIRVRISTRTESGVMEVTLLDEAGEVVYAFGSAKYQERRYLYSGNTVPGIHWRRGSGRLPRRTILFHKIGVALS